VFKEGDRRTKHCEKNVGKNFLHIICSQFLLNSILSCYYCSQMLDIFKDLLGIIESWYCPAFWWQDMVIYLVTSRPTSLQVSLKALFFFMVLMFLLNILTSSAWTIQFMWFLVIFLDFLMTHSKAKLKSNGDKASLHSRSSWVGH